MSELGGMQVLVPGRNGHGTNKTVCISNEVPGKVRIIIGSENAYIEAEDLADAWKALFPVTGRKHGGTF